MTFLFLLFLISIFFGPVLNTCCTRFGSWMAAIAHFGAVIVMVAFFELLWFLEGFDISHVSFLHFPFGTEP